jgi:glucose/arabinose dehydrogenase
MAGLEPARPFRVAGREGHNESGGSLITAAFVLHGPYRHELKNLVIGPDNKLCVDVAASTNADPIEQDSTERNEIECYYVNGLAQPGLGTIFLVRRSRKTGYKVIFFPWQDGRPGGQIDLVTGWLDDQSQSQWGRRPVDVKPAADGSVLISDDYSGTVYRLAPLVGQ